MQLEKECTKCKLVKSFEEFEKKKTGKHGIGSWCKPCKSKDRSKYDRAKRYKEYNLAYYYRNKTKWVELKAKRRAALLSAVPSWLSENDTLSIRGAYNLSKYLTEISKQKYEVDHIIPLQGDNVCGLHVPGNLQVISQEKNRRKSNKWVP